MARYMLDTDTCGFIMRGASDVLLKRLLSVHEDEIVISAITAAELQYGVENAGQKYRKANQQTLNRFLTYYKALPWPSDAAKSYAVTRLALKQKGNMIGANDLLIASHALHENLTVVTNNTREFARVAGLSVENWTSSD